jgi:sarcosine oxidase, subunit gamma
MELFAMLELSSKSALAHRTEPTDLAISIREITGRGMIDLRGHTSDRKFMTAVKGVLGFDLPKQPRTTTTWGDMRALWLSPDQWLILCSGDKAQALSEQLTKALEGVHSLAVNVSDMRAIIRIEGEHARTTLMKGTSIDLTHGDYTPSTVRRMRFAEIAALLHIVENNVIDIYVFRSYADYTWEWLLKAGRKGSEVRLFARV